MYHLLAQSPTSLPALSLSINQILIVAAVAVLIAAMIPNPFQPLAAKLLSWFTGGADTNKDGKATAKEVTEHLSSVAELIRQLKGGDKTVIIDLLKMLTEEHEHRTDIDLSPEIAALWARLITRTEAKPTVALPTTPVRSPSPIVSQS